jgi:hypothetical protein
VREERLQLFMDCFKHVSEKIEEVYDVLTRSGDRKSLLEGNGFRPLISFFSHVVHSRRARGWQGFPHAAGHTRALERRHHLPDHSAHQGDGLKGCFSHVLRKTCLLYLGVFLFTLLSQRLWSFEQLSGGEKSLASLALIFAIQSYKVICDIFCRPAFARQQSLI